MKPYTVNGRLGCDLQEVRPWSVYGTDVRCYRR